MRLSLQLAALRFPQLPHLAVGGSRLNGHGVSFASLNRMVAAAESSSSSRNCAMLRRCAVAPHIGLFASSNMQLRLNSTNATTAAAASAIPDRPPQEEEAPKAATAATASNNTSSERSQATPSSSSSSGEGAKGDDGNNSANEDGSSSPPPPPPPPQGRLKRLMGLFKGMSLKEIIKQYGLPIALFYWVFNEVLVAIVTYLLHFNYVSQNSVVDIIEALGFGSWVDTKVLATHSLRFPYGIEISALLITNFLVASAFLALFVPVKLPFCIWVFPKVRRSFRKVFPKRVKAPKAGAAAPPAAAAAATAASSEAAAAASTVSP